MGRGANSRLSLQLSKGADGADRVLACPFRVGSYLPGHHSLHHSLLFYLPLTFLLHVGSPGSCLGTFSNCDLSLCGSQEHQRAFPGSEGKPRS